MLLASLGAGIANVALPILAEAFVASFQEVQWVVLAYLLATTTTIVGVGRLADVMGRRRLLLAGLLLFTLASALCGLASSLWQLVGARALQGLGAAAVLALTLAMIGDSVPRERIGKAMGLLGTMSAIGTGLGPSIGGILIAVLGWRVLFLAPVPLGLAAILLVRRHLRADTPRRASSGFDLRGTLLLALALGAYALAMTPGRGSFGPLSAALLVGAAFTAGLFLLAENKAASPLIRPALIRDPLLGGGFAMSGLVATVMMATLVIGPFYLSGVLGLQPASVGLAMSAGPAVAALAGIPSGRAVDRFGASRSSAAGLAGVAGGCALLAATPPTLGVIGYLVPIAIVTAGYALFQAANNSAVMGAVVPGEKGVVSAMLNLSRNFGLVTGASAMGAVFAAAGMRVTFAAAAGLALAALALGSRAAAAAGPEGLSPSSNPAPAACGDSLPGSGAGACARSF